MTKADINSEISSRTGVGKDAVNSCVEAFMQVVKNALTKGESVYLRGFGTFTLKERAAKLGRNVRKGTPVLIEAHRVPSFKPCDEFKQSVR